MLRTTIISVWNYDYELSGKINNWIERNHETCEVKDIKYSQVFNDRNNSIQYSAMILFVKK